MAFFSPHRSYSTGSNHNHRETGVLWEEIRLWYNRRPTYRWPPRTACNRKTIREPDTIEWPPDVSSVEWENTQIDVPVRNRLSSLCLVDWWTNCWVSGRGAKSNWHADTQHHAVTERNKSEWKYRIKQKSCGRLKKWRKTTVTYHKGVSCCGVHA